MCHQEQPQGIEKEAAEKQKQPLHVAHAKRHAHNGTAGENQEPNRSPPCSSRVTRFGVACADTSLHESFHGTFSKVALQKSCATYVPLQEFPP